MPDYPPYDPDAKCPKCGHGQASTQYVPRVSEYSFSMGTSRITVPEHLVRTCARCGYVWREATLDAGAADEQAEFA